MAFLTWLVMALLPWPKRLLLAVGMALLASSLPACEPVPGPGLDAATPDASDATPLGPRFPACQPETQIQRVTFVHVNDMHATFNPDNPDGPHGASSPAARIRGYYLEVLAENPYTIFTNGGDDYEKGWLAELRSGGAATREVTHAMGFDVRVLGNHDFAWGPWETLAYSQDPHGIVLATNLQWTGAGAETFGAVSYAAMNVGCLRVGFFGLVHKPYNAQNAQYDGPYFPGFDDPRFDYVNVAREVVASRRAEVDLLVLISHLGLAMDEHIAEWAPGIDLILSGHSHHVLPNPVNANGALIIQGGAYARFVGRLDLEVDLRSRRRLTRRFRLMANTPWALPVDPAVEATVRAQNAAWAPDWNTPVAEVSQERPWLEVAGVAAEAALEIHGADAALVDGWEIWGSWEPGLLTPQDILDTFRVERSPSGTSGFTSLHRVAISGQSLALLASRRNPGRWALSLATEPDPEATYSLVLQKHVVSDPDRHLPRGVHLIGLQEHLQETWEAVHAYALRRAAACLSLDSDAPTHLCP